MTQYRHSRIQNPEGFTLIELVIVVAILGILASMATVSYHYFVIKAQEVEGEIMVHEVERLESLYHIAHDTYTDNFTDLGFVMTGAVKYYTPEVRVGSATDMINYQVRAVPVAAVGTDAWLLTNLRYSPVQVDQMPVSLLEAFATERYLGNASAMTFIQAATINPGSGMPDSNEPKWSGGGSSTQCKECGNKVINQLEVPAPDKQ